MIRNIQHFLKKGLVKSSFNNLKFRKLIAATCFDFVEWAEDDNIKIGIRMYKKKVFEDFVEEYPDFKKWLTYKRMGKWIQSYAEHHELFIKTGRSQDGRWWLIEEGIKEDKEVEPKEEVAPF